MTHTTAADFLDAILAEPDRDDLRLIYADWLEENGDGERAEFVRVQIALAKCSKCGGSGRRPNPARNDPNRHNPGRFTFILGDTAACCQGRRAKALRRREQELLHVNEQRWARDIFGDRMHARPEKPLAISGWQFRRGFVAEIACCLAAWEAHGPAIVRSQPVEVVRVSDKRPWNSGNHRWGFSCAPADAEYGGDWWILPREIWICLHGSSQHFNTTYRRWWQTEADALAALSSGLLLWARDAAKPLDSAGVRG